MKNKIIILVCMYILQACNNTGTDTNTHTSNKEFAALLDAYYEEGLQLFPISATQNGDNRYNDRLSIDFTDSYREKLRAVYARYAGELSKFQREQLNKTEQLSYDVLKRDLQINMEGLGFHDNYFPFNQFYAMPLTLGQMGSGEGGQPFKTMQDYDNWIKRMSAFDAWADSAIVYFTKGMETGFVLPASLVKKMIPEMEAMVTADAASNLFYGPVNKIPASFSEADKTKIRETYTSLVNEHIIPTFKKLVSFLKNDYLPKARTSSGISGIPGGDKYYAYLVRQQTTTNKSPQEIYETGLSEVARIKSIMDSVKQSTGFTGDMQSFFNYMRNDKKFMPYKKPQEVLDAFEAIHQKMMPNINKMFTRTPKSPFEIRQTEAFRAASASAEYIQGTPDGSRPGIFYVPILDASAFNITSGMESLFLHEAIPGHHYQVSLQQEDTSLPRFRRFGGNNAYVEGWALYCESLGKELGLYTDAYQYMGALGDEMHRAIRLVVDVAIHTKNMTREEAIKYMMDNEAISEQGATAEIERYMAIPSQALGYKIGALKIKELRNKYEKQMGNRFSIAAFHDEILKDGALPLELLETKMDAWAK